MKKLPAFFTDNHIHTCFSGDSDAPVRSQIEHAIELGLSAITFTDHIDPDYPKENDLFIFNLEEYVQQISILKEEYKEQIEISIGIELGMRPEQYDLLNRISQDYPFDFCIGSIHVVDEMDPYYPEYWNKHDVRTGMRRFFEVTLECVQLFDFYDTLGHIDYLFRYVPKDRPAISHTDCMDIIDEILKSLVKKDKALECNTAGWKYGLPYAHPHPDILKRFHELGGRKITLGSDGHKPEHLAYDFERIPDYLKECGFEGYFRFIGHKPVYVNFSV